jgi:hypothetical protein
MRKMLRLPSMYGGEHTESCRRELTLRAFQTTGRLPKKAAAQGGGRVTQNDRAYSEIWYVIVRAIPRGDVTTTFNVALPEAVPEVVTVNGCAVGIKLHGTV